MAGPQARLARTRCEQELVLVLSLARASSECAPLRFLRPRLSPIALPMERTGERGPRPGRAVAARHPPPSDRAVLRPDVVRDRIQLLPLPQASPQGPEVGERAPPVALRSPHGAQPTCELVCHATLVRPYFADPSALCRDGARPHRSREACGSRGLRNEGREVFSKARRRPVSGVAREVAIFDRGKIFRLAAFYAEQGRLREAARE